MVDIGINDEQIEYGQRRCYIERRGRYSIDWRKYGSHSWF